MKNKIFISIISLCCLSSGYFFYKMNNGDWINGSIFAIGLTGIVLSFIRNQEKK